jgi:hypothetical protein
VVDGGDGGAVEEVDGGEDGGEDAGAVEAVRDVIIDV